ncbi:MAG: hypothetical protein RL693_2264 [Verrucomicrobiota bacterium]
MLWPSVSQLWSAGYPLFLRDGLITGIEIDPVMTAYLPAERSCVRGSQDAYAVKSGYVIPVTL